jgi:glycosyltransferase involved in cell wall biosynthesis
MNFGPDHNYHAKENSAAPYVFLGRLTEEKGITHLAANWPSNKRLLVYGDGPLMNATKAIENPGLEIMGRVARTDIPKILAGSRALVISTECAEGAVATTYIEALSAGIPTVALAGSSAADHISANGTGLVYSNYSELDDALDKLNRDWRSFSNQVDRVYAEQFTKDVWLRNINSLYESMRDGSVVGRRTDNQ